MIRWSPAASRAFAQTLAHIHQQSPSTCLLVAQRVQNALDMIESRPMIGTALAHSNARRFAVPRTGHFIEYRPLSWGIYVVRWARQSRLRKA